MITIFTDTDADVTPEIAQRYGYKLISMPFYLNEKEIYPYVDSDDFDFRTFYDELRSGTIPKTFALNPEKYIDYFEPEFEAGNDVLYVHFSSEISSTFDALKVAQKQLAERFPERRIYTIDTKAASIGALGIVCEIGEMYNQGKSVEQIIEWAEQNIQHFATYFYAVDLKFFAKSGRITNFSALFGTMLGFHPILSITKEGKLTSIGKVRGRKNAVNELIRYVEELQEDICDHTLYICHCDSEQYALNIGERLQEKFNGKLKIEYITVNPTVGCHCGPDTVGVSFRAKHR